MATIERTASEWLLWSQARRREAEAVRRRYLSEAEKAADVAVNFDCTVCDPQISVRLQAGQPDFSRVAVMHELTCTANG